jgi:ABC-2 type transport system permease protein
VLFRSVYYPVATLPAVLQPIAWALPTTYVFEGLRALVIHHTFRADLMAIAYAMNALWFVGAVAIFYRLLASARRSGSLLQQGE